MSDLHPVARDLAINPATLNRVQTDADYFRALITDADTAPWEDRPIWQERAKQAGWFAKDRKTLLTERHKAIATPLIVETADYFEAEIKRMAGTALEPIPEV